MTNNSLLFMELPTSVFQLYFRSRKFLKALPLMLLLENLRKLLDLPQMRRES